MVAVTPLARRLRACDLDELPHEWDTLYELIGGTLHMSRKPGYEHQLAAARLMLRVGPAVAERGGVALLEPGLVFEDKGDDNVAPDFVAYLRPPAVPRGEKLRVCPDIVAEILSPGEENRQRDLVAKRDLYWRRGAKEYWVFDLENRLVLRLTRAAEGWREDVLREGDRLVTPLLVGWAGIPVSDILGQP